MPHQVGVIGSSNGVSQELAETAYIIGTMLATSGIVLLTGGATGVSYHAATGMRAAGGLVVVVSPFDKATTHAPSVDTEPAHCVIRSGFGFKGRNVILMNSADGVIALAGSVGTLNELTIAIDAGKPIVIVKGTGGVCDVLEDLLPHIRTYTRIRFVSDASKCVTELMDMLQSAAL